MLILSISLGSIEGSARTSFSSVTIAPFFAGKFRCAFLHLFAKSEQFSPYIASFNGDNQISLGKRADYGPTGRLQR